MFSRSNASEYQSQLEEPGSSTRYSLTSLRLGPLIEEWHFVAQLTGLALIVGTAKLVGYLQIFPSIGPVIVAIFSACSHPTVVLYLVMIGLSQLLFGVAIHIAANASISIFSSLPLRCVILLPCNALFQPM